MTSLYSEVMDVVVIVMPDPHRLPILYTPGECSRAWNTHTGQTRSWNYEQAHNSYVRRAVCPFKDGPRVPGATACADGAARATDRRGAPLRTLRAGERFRPQVSFGGRWFPPCGHQAWGSNAWPSMFCRELGFRKFNVGGRIVFRPQNKIIRSCFH